MKPIDGARDLELFSGILLEVAGWLEAGGRTLWGADELTPEALLGSYRIEEMYLGTLPRREPAAVMVLREADKLFWPDAPEGESLFLHKLAVKRHLKGRGASTAMLDHARGLALTTGKKYLRLDCAVDLPRLREFYEGYGFRYVGRRMVGAFDLAFYELRLR